jgi:hypothetical protein
MKITWRLCVLLVAAGTATVSGAATGDTYVYRIVNGYNHETAGSISYRVEKSDADRVEVTVTPDAPRAGSPRTEVYTREGNWLRYPLVNHDQFRDYEFATPFPANAAPGEQGDSWSVRMQAFVPASGKYNSVRVDGKLLGPERITVPAGTFDTIKVTRRIYAGDWEGFMRETNIVQTDWFAPALGRPVKSETQSSWQDLSRCGRGGCPWFRGDWNVFELASVERATP